MPEAVRLIIDGAEMAELLRGDHGPVMRTLDRRADAVMDAARSYIRMRKKTEKPGDRLERSIVKRHLVSERGPIVEIVAGVGLEPNYAFWVHEGNGPPGARIYPKKKRVLAWTSGPDPRPTTADGWKVARATGVAIIRPSVKTSKPMPYLRENLRIALTVF
jgi:hypothetical protein